MKSPREMSTASHQYILKETGRSSKISTFGHFWTKVSLLQLQRKDLQHFYSDYTGCVSRLQVGSSFPLK
ncbi:unnamed protein product, partial [Cylicostephanus goldi]